jgi:hypothetical protein
MKFTAVVIVLSAVLFYSTEVRCLLSCIHSPMYNGHLPLLVANPFSLHYSTLQAVERQLKKGKSERKVRRVRIPKAERRSRFIGDCSVLTNSTFKVATGYTLNDHIIYNYPCSGGYLKNFASNYNLLQDVFDAINTKGREMGLNVDCANLCDIDKASYETIEQFGEGNIGENLINAEIFCEPETGVFNDPTQIINDNFKNAPNGTNACTCAPEDDYFAGCYECSGTVQFSVKTCLDSSVLVGTKASYAGYDDSERL